MSEKTREQEWEIPTSAKGVHVALCKVQADLCRVGVGKNAKNEQQKFMYRAWDEVQQALAPLLPKHHLLMLPHVTERKDATFTTAKGSNMFRVMLKGRIEFISVEDGSTVSYEAQGEGMDAGDKATSKAMTMMVKYALTHGLCIPLEGIEDGDRETVAETITPEPDYVERLNTAAAAGVDAFREEWKAVPRNERESLKPRLSDWQQMAENADRKFDEELADANA